MTENPPAGLAQEHLARALRAHDEGHEGEAVVWLHAAAETAVSRLAARARIGLGPGHRERITAAYELAEEASISPDAPALLVRLNDERKRFLHGGAEPDLRGRTWATVFRLVESLAEAAREERPKSD